MKRILVLVLLGLVALGSLLLAVACQQVDGGMTMSTGRVSARGFPPAPAAQALAQARDIGAARALADPSSLPSIDEELWVIARPSKSAATPAAADDDVPGCGALITRLPAPGESEAVNVPVPLEHTDVAAAVQAYISTVRVRQTFHNPYDSKIEAVYVFPLPENAAVNEFLMTVGDRTIRGIIRDRAEAEQIYTEARAAGHIASLLTQERPNIFTQKVANIEPGKRIDIDITYFSTLRYDDGWYEWVFPMVVGPRFNPPGSTNRVAALPRGGIGGAPQGSSGQQTEVQYLAPTERSGHDISLAVDIDAGVAIEEIACRSHVVQIQGWTGEGPANGSESASFARVRLSEMDSIPNKDFVLRWKVAGDEVKTALLTHTDERGGFFTLMVVPPAEMNSLGRRPLEMVFVIDCSGSMSGEPIAQAKGAVKRGLRRLRNGDSFQVIRFSQRASQFGAAPVEATTDNIDRAVRWVDQLEGGGGTMMIEGIKAALDFPHDAERLRFVTFLTDGYIGNEADILAAIHDKLGASRIFSFGVGSSPNRYLMDAMAKMGRGAVAYLGLHDSATDVMDAFMDRASHAALTDIEVDWGGLQVSEVYPGGADASAAGRVPDLFVGRPVILSGRFQPASLDLVSHITLRGRAAGGNAPGDDGAQWVEWPVQVHGAAPARFASATPSGSAEPAFVPRLHALPAVWARQKIADLADRALWMPGAELEAPQMIRSVALEYGLMSAFTAFVAVDSLSHTEGEYGTTVNVPVPVPEGVRYETTVPGG